VTDGSANGDPVGVRLDRIEARMTDIERLLERLARLIEQAVEDVRAKGD
jgi:hypothetical protein